MVLQQTFADFAISVFFPCADMKARVRGNDRISFIMVVVVLQK